MYKPAPPCTVNQRRTRRGTMTKKMPETIDEIIKKHVIFSMTAGAIPIPLVDIAAVTAIQLDLIKDIAELYDVPYDKNQGKSIASALAGASFARFGASIVKSIPGIGTLAGLASQVVLSGASTYALGKIFESHFSADGDLFTLETDAVKQKYKEFLKKGKDFASGLRKEGDGEDVLATIEKLQGLKESGAISEEEFQKTKKELLKKISS